MASNESKSFLFDPGSIQDQHWSPGEDDIESPAYWRIVSMYTKDTEPELRRKLSLENCFLVVNIVLDHCL